VKHLIVGVVMAAFAMTAVAQDRRPSYGPSVNLAAAKKIVAATIAECQKQGWNVAVAVVDTHGALVSLDRMDDTQIAGIEIAIMKAKAAATYRRTTRAFEDALVKGRIATVTFPGVVASPGGVPIMADGKVTGAVGVSGVLGDQDEQCALAGIKAM
jgi:uncharacterized protein GlcG (DUF336 family)